MTAHDKLAALENEVPSSLPITQRLVHSLMQSASADENEVRDSHLAIVQSVLSLERRLNEVEVAAERGY